MHKTKFLQCTELTTIKHRQTLESQTLMDLGDFGGVPILGAGGHSVLKQYTRRILIRFEVMTSGTSRKRKAKSHIENYARQSFGMNFVSCVALQLQSLAFSRQEGRTVEAETKVKTHASSLAPAHGDEVLRRPPAQHEFLSPVGTDRAREFKSK
eukprot:4652833-Amphidinium_carterae.2